MMNFKQYAKLHESDVSADATAKIIELLKNGYDETDPDNDLYYSDVALILKTLSVALTPSKERKEYMTPDVIKFNAKLIRELTITAQRVERL